jgi:FkbM family methyltransferase
MNYFKFFRKLFLTKHFRFAYGQFGEDIPIYMLFRKRQHGSFYVDVGAFHPTKWSNSFYLYKKGWRGVLVEMQPEKALGLRIRRPKDIVIQEAVSEEPGEYEIYSAGDYSPSATIEKPENRELGTDQVHSTVKARTLTQMLDGTKYAKRKIDLLSVDAEGHDLAVLRSLDFDIYRPSVIAVESHTITMPQLMETELHAFLSDKNYDLVNRVGFTCLYTDPDFIGTHSLV